jgi:DNA-binding transcriptional MerR regulator
MQDEKVTIQVAAKALNVTTKTIHQWLKNGALTRVKEGNRTYILMDEVRALRQNRVTNQKSEVTTFKGNSEPSNNLSNNMVPIDRAHYEGLLTRLGQLEAKQQLMLEYKQDLQAKDEELIEARVIISKARSELEKMVELKRDAEAKAKALLEQQAKTEAKEKELAEIRAENERLKRLKWWNRLFRRK